MRNVKRSGQRNLRRRKKVASPFRTIAVPLAQKPARGVKLKTVSRLTLLFALLCLAAFLAGRPPAAPQSRDAFAVAAQAARLHRGSLRDDNSRRILFRLRR